MSELPPTPQKLNSNNTTTRIPQDNSVKFRNRQLTVTFVSWYKQMIDHERQNLGLYLSDDALLEWFGRTIKTKKKVSAFLKHDMQCSRHNFVSVKSIDMIKSREDKTPGKEQNDLASLQQSPEVISSRIGKRRILRSNCNSPEWADGCQPVEEIKEESSRKKVKATQHLDSDIKCDDVCQRQGVKRSFNEDSSDLNSKGDGDLDRRVKCKLVPVTPPNREVGQGDCMPSTSGADSDRSHEALNAQLPKFHVECNGYIQFMRTRNSNNNRDAIKWERKCKIQISYSEDPLNVGEYIIWAIHYTDESRCRRNLLPAFEEIAKDE